MKITHTYLDEELNEIIKEYDFDEALNEFPADDIDTLYVIPNNGVEESLINNTILEKTLTSFHAPGVTCSWKGCKFYKVRHGIYAKVYFPETIEEAGRNKINNCFTVGVAAAIVAIAGMTINLITIAGAAAIAYTAFEGAFLACMGDSEVLSFLQYHVKYESHKE